MVYINLTLDLEEECKGANQTYNGTLAFNKINNKENIVKNNPNMVNQYGVKVPIEWRHTLDCAIMAPSTYCICYLASVKS